MKPRLAHLARPAALGLALALASPLLLSALLKLSSPPSVDIGPGDRSYVQGLSAKWRYDGEKTWRDVGRRARVGLPITLEGPGAVAFSVSQPDAEPVALRILFDDGTSWEIFVPQASGFRDVTVELPRGRSRAQVRLRAETRSGGVGRLRIDEVRWKGRRIRPQLGLVRDSALLLLLTFSAFCLAGAPPLASVLATLCLSAALLAIGADSSFAVIGLIRRGAWVAITGAIVVGGARLVMHRPNASFLSLVYGALLLKSLLLFHPSYYFFDLPIHETLLELVYHRGPVDFWARLPDYQVRHNLGLAPVDGIQQPFPYPALFYLLAHLGNRFAHEPVFWLKLTAALAGSLALFPAGYLARRFSTAPRADVLAAAVYLLTPAYTRSLLLLELSALLGHCLDLTVVACLAGISLDFRSWKRVLSASTLVALAAAAYPAGFIHLGLLVGLCLVLAPWVQGLTRDSAFRLAAAALLGAVVALISYHPTTLANLLFVILPTGVGASTLASPSLAEQAGSLLARGRQFLGWVLPLVGAAGVVQCIRRAASRPQRLLVSAWVFSAALACTLRFALPELLRFQKELYWTGALLAVATGALLARLAAESRRGRVLAILLLVVAGTAGFLGILEMLPRFYTRYLLL